MDSHLHSDLLISYICIFLSNNPCAPKLQMLQLESNMAKKLWKNEFFILVE